MDLLPNPGGGGGTASPSVNRVFKSARALANSPNLILADEPTGNLDQKSSNAVTDLLFSINELINTTLVLVTHDLLLAEKCEDLYELSDGSLL